MMMLSETPPPNSSSIDGAYDLRVDLRTLADQLRRIAADDRVGLNVARYHGAGAIAAPSPTFTPGMMIASEPIQTYRILSLTGGSDPSRHIICDQHPKNRRLAQVQF